MYHHHRHDPLFRYFLLFLVAVPLLSPASSSTTQTTTSAHGTLTISTTDNVTIVTICNPPINLYDLKLSTDVFYFLTSLDPANRTTPPPKVVIFRSADPHFFIPHIDVNLFIPQFPPLDPAKIALGNTYTATTSLLQSLTATVFIGEVDGEASGAGNELLVQMDMRFAGPNAKVSSLETSLGVTHGSGGMQFLGRLIGKGRALQYLLSGDYADCKLGKELGWFNDCYESREELEDKVGALAKKIGLRPQAALNATKAGLQSMNPPLSVLQADLNNFIPLANSPAAQALLHKLLVLGKNQTRSPFELGMPETIGELYE
ncbi:unnamed protein product [Calypogeia fissa]